LPPQRLVPEGEIQRQGRVSGELVLCTSSVQMGCWIEGFRRRGVFVAHTGHMRTVNCERHASQTHAVVAQKNTKVCVESFGEFIAQHCAGLWVYVVFVHVELDRTVCDLRQVVHTRALMYMCVYG